MNELQRLIRLSYGHADLIFNSHSIEMTNAAKSIVTANNNNIGMQEFIQMHVDFLTENNCSDEHIKEQIVKVKDVRSYFVND